MKKILMSLSMIAVVGVVVAGATGAFFSDTETSTGNTFTAGAIDLKVDSKCHYYNITSLDLAGNPVYTDVGCGEVGTTNGVGVGVGQWSETDLENGVHKFFSFADIKPGDKGEDTISLHVYDNDAWGRILMDLGNSLDNTCTEPESEEESNCTPDGDGELLAAMLPGFSMWLDQGSTPGFQNTDANGDPVSPVPDSTEGDNIWQRNDEPSVPVQGELKLSGVLASAYSTDYGIEGPENNCTITDGHANYGYCNGLALDGRMVGSTTYYLGLAWELPLETGNDVQTDSLSGDVTFEVEQHRNNPSPFAPAP